MENENTKNINWWKRAFITLIIIIFLFFMRLLFLIQPKSIHQEKSNIKDTDQEEVVLETSLHPKDAEKLMNQFLENNNEETSNYTVELTTELLLHGDIDIFGLEVPFSLSFDPYVLEDGNVQLKAKKLNLSAISLPVDIALSLIVTSLEIPDFIAVDSKEQIIVILFDQLKSTSFHVEFTKIDLENDLITLNLYMNDYSNK